jgi:hypothetical protein
MKVETKEPRPNSIGVNGYLRTPHDQKILGLGHDGVADACGQLPAFVQTQRQGRRGRHHRYADGQIATVRMFISETARITRIAISERLAISTNLPERQGSD